MNEIYCISMVFSINNSNGAPRVFHKTVSYNSQAAIIISLIDLKVHTIYEVHIVLHLYM